MKFVIFLLFLPIWMKFNAGDVHKNLLYNLEFPEHSRSVTHREPKFPSVRFTFTV